MVGKPAPLFSKVWKTAPADDAAATRLAAESGLPMAAARLLAGRGLTDAGVAEQFLHPRLSALADPFLLPGMAAAVTRIWQAIDARERIVVFGDYDVDGITSTVLMLGVLRALGADPAPFLPHRMDEGYGLSLEGLGRCIAEHKPRLIVTVDCGTGSAPAVRLAAESGIDVVVTDHHAPGAEIAPAVAVINPKLGTRAADQLLAGVGVAFKLAHALVKRGREMGRSAASLDLRGQLDLVALGTVADLVPLTGENRALVRMGLDLLGSTNRIGIAELKAVAGIAGPVEAYDVGFKLGPRLNAAGRLGDALNSLSLLDARDAATARTLAKHLDDENRARQEVEAAIVAEAFALLDADFDPDRYFGLVAARPGWHAGVVGIVASRIVQRYARPAVVIAMGDESGRGSGRSIEDFDLHAALTDCRSHLVKFGGHAMAAGLEVEAGRVDSFRAAFNEAASLRLKGRDLRPVQRIDVWMDALGDADDQLLEVLDSLKPFGIGNTTPVWGARSVRIVGEPRYVGADRQHAKLVLAQGAAQRDAIWFGAGSRELPVGPVDVAFQLRRNDYMGRSRPDLHIQDLRPAQD